MSGAGSGSSDSASWPRADPGEARAFMRRCVQAVGVSETHAEVLADVLVRADERGHYSHGLNRLDMYVKDVQQDITAVDKEPEILKQTPATAWVEGHNLIGPVVGKFCMDLAIEKAKNVGIGWVVAKGSNHYGIAGWYSMRASQQGLIGLSATNASPIMVPTRARQKTLGTNPLSVAAPSNKEGDDFVLDMATTSVAFGKVEINHRKGMDIPDNWGCDGEGKPSNDAELVISEGGLLPLGGTEQSSGYKGYGLAMMVEVFSGLLGGGAYGPNIRSWKTREKIANLGQCFAAIDPNAFAPDFPSRMGDLMDSLRGLETVEGETEVLVAGDPERRHEKKTAENGIPYHPNQILYMENLAKELNVAPMPLLG